MRIIVQKYGGSSVADVEKIKFVAQKVVATRKQGFHVVVVVSAMGNTTDELLELASQINATPERRELDMLLSVGERISMTLLSMAIHTSGVDAISFTGSQSGIITTASHSEARVVEVRPYRIQDELEAGKVVIVAGYQGVSYRREVTTLGRGGSDTTAVALAAALGAEACEIYSDVEGVFSSDPRIVEDAQMLTEMGYEEMQELARLGARVVNQSAVEFARKARIALYARSTRGVGAGTVIHGGGGFRRVDGFEDEMALAERAFGVRAVSGIKAGLYIALDDAETGAEAIDGLMEELNTHQTPLLEVSPTEGRARIFLSLENVHDTEALIGRLRARCLTSGSLTVDDRLALVAAVGNGVGDRPRVARAALAALRARGIGAHHVRASGPSVSLVVGVDHLPEAMRALHKRLIQDPP